MEWPLVGRESDLDHAVELVEAGTGIAFLGPAGVGKSRLLHELGDRSEAVGKSVINAVASESTSSIPFAPFVELLPEGPSQDRLMMLGRALGALQDRNRGRGLVMTVDDAHHLDASSLALLVQAVSSGAATVCLTVRTGEQMHPDLVDLWTNGVIERVDLPPLTDDDSLALTEAVLGPIESGLREELWRLSEGNPLVLHELIEGAANQTVVAGDDGVWHQAGPIAESARVADLVMSRLRALPEDLRPGMDVVAVGFPLPLHLALAASGESVAKLEDRGLVRVVAVSGERTVIPAHPLYGEILQANIGESRKRRALDRLVEAALEGGSVDSLRVAVWQADSGRLRSRSIATEGAAQALTRHDPGLAEQLVRPLGKSEVRAQVILGRALSYQQNFIEAEDVLSKIGKTGTSVDGEAASVRAQNLAFGLGRIQEARDLLESAVSEIEDVELRARLNNERGMISAIRGDFVDAKQAASAVLEDENSGEVSRVAAYATLTVAQAMTGDSTGLENVMEPAIPMAIRVRDELPFAEDQIEIMRVMGMLNAGRIAQAVGLASEAVSREGRGSAMITTWLSALGLSLDLAGLHTQAVERLTFALELYETADPFGLEPQARGLLALELAQMGTDGGAAIGDLVLEVPAPRLTVWVERGKAWNHVVRDDVDAAIEILIEGGRHAVAHEHYAWGTLCFHDVVRLGRPSLVLDDLSRLPDMREAHLQDTMRRHATALATEDLQLMTDTAARFVTMGANLLAAEAWAQVTALATGPAERARAALVSSALEGRCEGSVTPALTGRPSEVSERETQVAIAAASGMASQEIADSNFISTRTVENHLQSVYRKLGIGSREELRQLLTGSLG